MRTKSLRCLKRVLYATVGLVIVLLVFGVVLLPLLHTHILRGAKWWDIVYVKNQFPDGGYVLRTESTTDFGSGCSVGPIRIERSYVVISSDSGRIRISVRCGSGPKHNLYETEWHTEPILGGLVHVGRVRIQSDLNEINVADDLDSDKGVGDLRVRITNKCAPNSTQVRIEGLSSPGFSGAATWGLGFTLLKLLSERREESGCVENLNLENRSLEDGEARQHAERDPEYDAYCEVRLWVVPDREPMFEPRVIPAKSTSVEQLKETLMEEALKMRIAP